MRASAWLLGCLLLSACQDYGGIGDLADACGPDGGCLGEDGDQGPPGDACGVDGGCRPDDPGPLIYPECQERGGACHWLEPDWPAVCPAGHFEPLSGFMRHCPTDSIQLCCAPLGGLGSPCILEAPCAEGACFAESSGFPPGGLCSQSCDPDRLGDCPAWQVCLPVLFSAAPGMCLPGCARDEHCRAGFSCQALPLRPWGATDGTTRNVCWTVGAVLPGLGLGELCAQDGDCLSGLCRPDTTRPGRDMRCTATCHDQACLPGYACTTSPGGARLCFPE